MAAEQREGAAEQREGAASDKARAEFLWNVHSYVNEYIRFADAKGAVVIAWSSALIGALFSANVHHRFTHARLTLAEADGWDTLLGVLAVASFAALAAAFLIAVWSVVPRLPDKREPGFIFWERVRAHGSRAKYHSELRTRSASALAEEIAEHVFVLGGVATDKYRYVRLSIYAALMGSVMGAFTVLLVSYIASNQ